MRELEDWARELHEEYGYRSARLLNRDELQAHVRSARYLGGLIDSRSGHLHPLKFTQGVARAAESAGARNLRELPGAALSRMGPRSACTPRKARCAARIWCSAAMPTSGAVAPALARRILGVGTYIIATEPLGEERARALLPSNAAIADINWILDYFRRSADHRLLFGGRVSYSAVQPPRLAESMRKRMVRIFPTLADVKVAHAWGGYLDITMSRAPDFGRLAPNVFYLQGFSGHGMALTGLAGKLVAEAVAGTAERFDVFARIPHRDFPGGSRVQAAVADDWRCCTTGCGICCEGDTPLGDASFGDAPVRAHVADGGVDAMSAAAVHFRPGFSLPKLGTRVLPVSSRVTEFKLPPCDPSRSGLNVTLTRSPALMDWRVHPARVNTPGLVVSSDHSCAGPPSFG